MHCPLTLRPTLSHLEPRDPPVSGLTDATASRPPVAATSMDLPRVVLKPGCVGTREVRKSPQNSRPGALAHFPPDSPSCFSWGWQASGRPRVTELHVANDAEGRAAPAAHPSLPPWVKDGKRLKADPPPPPGGQEHGVQAGVNHLYQGRGRGTPGAFTCTSLRGPEGCKEVRDRRGRDVKK